MYYQKVFGYILASMLSCIVFLGSANACSTCTAPPTELEEYTMMMQEVVGALSSGEGDTTKVPETFSSIFVLHAMPVLVAGQDFFADRKIMWNTYPVMRDRQKLKIMDDMISRAIVSSASNGLFFETLGGDCGKIQPLADFPLFNGLNFSECKMTHGDALRFAWSVNQLYKQVFLYSTNTNVNFPDMEDYCSELFKQGALEFGISPATCNIIVSAEEEKPLLNMNYIDSMQSKYRCSTFEDECPGNIQDFIINAEKIISMHKGDGEISVDEILKTYTEQFHRLKNALLEAEISRNEPEKSSMEFDFGKNLILDKNDKGFFRAAWMWAQLQENVDKMKTKSNCEGECKYNLFGELSSNPLYIDPQDQPFGKFDRYILRAELDEYMDNTVQSVLDFQEDVMQDTVMQTPRPEVTEIFTGVSGKIYDVYRTIGRTDEQTVTQRDGTSTESVLYNMGTACDKQCFNLGGECWPDPAQ